MTVTVSIVSHGHSRLVKELIRQIAAMSYIQVKQLVITSNIPDTSATNLESEFNTKDFQIVLIKNSTPLGFGANHNQAFKLCKTDYFCALNPDVVFKQDPFAALLQVFTNLEVSCAYPIQIQSNGSALDSERELVSPWSIVKRHLPFVGKRLRQQMVQAQTQGDKPVHWVNGAFMLFRSDVFRQLGGFDERYFMYGEDVDICLRMQLAGYTLARANATVIHNTQRRTLHDMRHFAWHVRSLLRLWRSDSYRDFKRRFIRKTV